VEPSIFSEADREYIRKWMEAHPEDINYDFDIEGTRKKSAAVTESMGSGRYKASNYYYEIGVRNASRDTVSDIKIEYRLFFENSEEIDKDDDSIRFLGDGTRMLQGEQKLERDLEFNRTLFFNTKAVLIEVVDYGHGRRKKDELHGCLVRISGPEGRVITEWTSSELSMQGKTWANTTPRESPAEGPAVIR
jgi:hypothetical protein